MTEEITTRIPLADKFLEFIGTQGMGSAGRRGSICEIKKRIET